MEYFEILVLNNFHLKPKCWFQLVHDTFVSYQIYRKKTHIDRYPHAHSHHHLVEKYDVLKTLIFRAIQISTPQHLDKERSILTNALQANDYYIS